MSLATADKATVAVAPLILRAVKEEENIARKQRDHPILAQSIDNVLACVLLSSEIKLPIVC